ncbi:MAG TPA: TIGR03557 family F420-dependent LLM class oxidoreductase [Acidimicrobiia bacterium]
MTRFAYFCGHEQWHPEDLVQHAILAEEAGFDAVVVSEHFHPWVDDQSASGFAFSTIGAMAAATSRVELITGVTTPLFRYHPGVVAQAAATLDRLCSGRFTLGVGTGENINEGPLGFEFPAYAERNSRMAEAIEIMRRLLDGEKLSFEGAHYRTDRARLYSPPVGPVPILLAAGGPKSAALAGASAQGVIVSVKSPSEAIENVITPLREAAAGADRPSPIVLATRWSIMADDDEEAWRAIYPWRGLRAPGRLEAVDPADLRAMADSMPREEILERYARATSAAEVVDAYRPLVEQVGADYVTFQMASLDQPELIRILGKEVLPALRAVAEARREPR